MHLLVPVVATAVAVLAFLVVPFHVNGDVWTTFAAVFWEMIGEISASPPSTPGEFAIGLALLMGPVTPLAPAVVAWEWHLLDACASSRVVSGLLVLQALVILFAAAMQGLMVWFQGYGIGFGGSFEVGTLLWPVLAGIFLVELGAVGTSIWLAFRKHYSRLSP